MLKVSDQTRGRYIQVFGRTYFESTFRVCKIEYKYQISTNKKTIFLHSCRIRRQRRRVLRGGWSFFLSIWRGAISFLSASSAQDISSQVNFWYLKKYCRNSYAFRSKLLVDGRGRTVFAKVDRQQKQMRGNHLVQFWQNDEQDQGDSHAARQTRFVSRLRALRGTLHFQTMQKSLLLCLWSAKIGHKDVRVEINILVFQYPCKEAFCPDVKRCLVNVHFKFIRTWTIFRCDFFSKLCSVPSTLNSSKVKSYYKRWGAKILIFHHREWQLWKLVLVFSTHADTRFG